MTARARHHCEICARPLNGRRGRPCIRGCGSWLCRRPHVPQCSDVHGGMCPNRPIPEEDRDMNSSDEPDGLSTADTRAVLAGLGIDSHVTPSPSGGPNVRLDRAALEKLRDEASKHGAIAIAAALDVALAALPDGEAS